MSSGWFADKVHSRIKAMVVWYAAAAVAMAFLAMFSERYMMIAYSGERDRSFRSIVTAAHEMVLRG